MGIVASIIRKGPPPMKNDSRKLVRLRERLSSLGITLRRSRHLEESVDQVIVSAVCALRTDKISRLPSPLTEVDRKNGSDGVSRFFLPILSVEEGSDAGRQDAFEAACLAKCDEVLSSGVDKSVLKETDGWVTVAISLRPDSGQAGIVITPEIFAAWKGVPVYFAIASI